MSTYSGITTSKRNNVVCDLRSDTVTSPDDAMREAMASVIVGDDVYGDEILPSIN